jgi:subtilisin family serine protease
LVAVEATAIDMTEPVVYIVQLQDAPLPSYRGDIKGLAATNPAVRGESKLDADAPASLAYMDYLAQEQAQAIAEVNAAIGRSLNVLYTYKAALNGFAAEMTAAEAAAVAKLPSVKYIEREHEYTLDTDAGPAWMGAPGLWDGSETGGLPGTYGEGIIIGVIDTGIDPWNPSFLDIGGDSYDHTNPWGADTYVGVCDATDPSYDATFPCNDKLIGAWGYASVNDGDPRDADGHGSHTSSTAGGNFVAGAVITTPSGVYTADISGVAPHANIVMYAACCTGAALTAAKEQVILDGVDVVNYSIGYTGGTPDLWTGVDTQTWLNVRDAGIFVATSAGNAGPGAATINGPGDAPWMLTVGASSHDRAFLNSITLDDGVNPVVTLEGQSMTGSYGPAQVVYAADYVTGTATADDARLCAPGAFPAGTFNGEIVVCERGAYGRVAKGQSVADGGAGGYVLAQLDEFGGGPGSVTSDPHVLPAVHSDYYAYQTLRSVVTGTAVVSGTIAGTTMDVDDKYGDIMASFSSRGPIRSEYFLKPDVTAPGRSIWAAYHQGDADGDYTFNVIQGTSMSSPHAAGAAALLRALHPEWTPAQVQAAMMTTARNTVLDEDGTSTATAFEQGAGHIDLGPAAQAGFVLDVTTQEFTDANPATGGDPSALNLASLPNNQCIGTCSWTRVLSSTQAASVSWTASTATFTDGITLTVTPATFDLAAHATQIITVEADVSGRPNDVWAFGEVTFVATSVPTAHFPVAVKASTGVLPDVVEIDAHRDADSILVKNLQALEITALTVDPYGLVEATLTPGLLDEDPTYGDPYDAFGGQADGAFYITVTVPADAKRLVAELVASEAPDLDLFVGLDLDGDGPDESEELCYSATGSWNEYCNITDPAAGTWWILVQNWGGSSSQPDALTLATAVVGADAGNMTITGPASVPVRTKFDLRVFWDESMDVGDYWYGAFDIGTDGDHHGNVGTVPVNLPPGWRDLRTRLGHQRRDGCGRRSDVERRHGDASGQGL